MYRQLCDILDRWLRIPPAPEAPPGDSAVVFRAAPAFFRYRMLAWAVGAIVPAVIGGFFFLVLIAGAATGSGRGGNEAAIILGGIASLVLAFFVLHLAVSFIALRLDYEKRWYVLTDRSLRVREGVWSVREMTVTFANIQNITIEQGPLQRIFKIADLKVDTAGGGGGSAGAHGRNPRALMNLHSARFRGVDNAEAIKELMQQRLRGARDSGLGDTDEHPAYAPPPPDNPALGALLERMLAEARALRMAAESASRLPAPPR